MGCVLIRPEAASHKVNAIAIWLGAGGNRYLLKFHVAELDGIRVYNSHNDHLFECRGNDRYDAKTMAAMVSWVVIIGFGHSRHELRPVIHLW